jgi:hypothetical protein
MENGWKMGDGKWSYRQVTRALVWTHSFLGSASSGGGAYPTFGAIFISLDAPNPAPKYPTSNSLGQDMVHGRICFRKKAGHFFEKVPRRN